MILLKNMTFWQWIQQITWIKFLHLPGKFKVPLIIGKNIGMLCNFNKNKSFSLHSGSLGALTTIILPLLERDSVTFLEFSNFLLDEE